MNVGFLTINVNSYIAASTILNAQYESLTINANPVPSFCKGTWPVMTGGTATAVRGPGDH